MLKPCTFCLDYKHHIYFHWVEINLSNSRDLREFDLITLLKKLSSIN
jgi:hypothetical protein